MAYKIIDIQGIGPVYAEKLIAVGIETVPQLLEAGAGPKGRKALEEKTGIRGDLILTWVNHADLFRIKGVGPQFSRNAANLAAKMLEVNEAKHLCKRTPVEKEIQKYINLAKELEPVVTY